MEKINNIFKNIKCMNNTGFIISIAEDRPFYDFIEKRKKNCNQNIIGGGIKKIKYIYNGNKFKLFENYDEGYNISVFRKDNKDEYNQKCLFIMIDNNGVAYIGNISYYKDCIKSGLEYPGGGSILLKMAITYLKENKNKYKIKIIQVQDNSRLLCEKNKKNIDLSSIYMLTKGDTWYSKHGFKPFDTDEMKLNKKNYRIFKNNQKKVKEINVGDTNIIKILKKK